MNRLIVMTGLAAVMTAPLLFAPATASASCQDRRLAGTVIGGVGGALIGNSISHGGGGAVLGGLGGAVIGHHVGGSGCSDYRSTAYYNNGSRYRYRGAYRSGYRSYRAQPQATRYVYYDQYGNPVSSGPAPVTPTYASTAYGYAGSNGCRTEMQSYYDSRGALLRRPVQVCSR